MLENCTKEERWQAVGEIIDRWLSDRQALIVEFCAASGVHELKPESPSAQMRLQKLCQLLLDYVSAGHFEVYYQLFREAEEFGDDSAELGHSILPYITESTEVSLSFNDKYTDIEISSLLELPKHLSKLGETLATRFDYEDQLIDAMHNAHASQVA